MSLFDTLLGKATRTPQARKFAAADPRKALRQHETLATRQIGSVKKLFKR